MSLAGASYAAPICQSPGSDPDGDGWGWENGQSCVVGTSAQDTTPFSTAGCIDSDGDGWGWDGTQSCRVDDSNPGSSTTASQPESGDSACIDSDGDGWGWNGTESCVVGGAPDDGGVSNPGQNETQDNDQVPTFDANSCQFPAGTIATSASYPVKSNGQSFFDNAGPQCVSPANQYNGPGLRYGDFLMLNNAWNGQASSWNWQQCIELDDSSNHTGVKLTYDWGNEDALQPGLQEWEVKSYPELVYGVKSQGEISGSCSDTGLPVRYDQMPDFLIDFDWSSTQTNERVGDIGDVAINGGDRNIAIESFFHTSCDIRRGSGNDNVEYEVMVWLDKGAERLPSGAPPVGEFTDSFGHTFDVYTKPNQNAGYVAYVARNKLEVGSVRWNDFFEDSKANGNAYGVKELKDSFCLANILFGSEIWWGKGSITLDHYEITRTY